MRSFSFLAQKTTLAPKLPRAIQLNLIVLMVQPLSLALLDHAKSIATHLDAIPAPVGCRGLLDDRDNLGSPGR